MNELIIMMYILVMSSLLTVIERKILSMSHRRLGPNYNGWFGLLQIIYDGIKLFYKDVYILGLIRSINNNISLFFPCIISFIYSYIIFIIYYLDIIITFPIPILFFLIIIIINISHIGIIICGLFTQSRWTILGSIRCIILYIIYDMILLMCWFILLAHNKLSINSYEIIGTLYSYINSQNEYYNIVYYPWLFIIFFLTILIESGRIPSDLTEAESELVSGYNIEYGGILYALFASAEYSTMFFNSITLSILLLSTYIFIIPIFLSFICIRATLPRLRYVDLLYFSWYYIIPFQLLFLSILLLL